ncbi:transmembrane 9 superfamily member 11-like isoform X2 [Triticum dicoccoides]|uniref:transmembrane 9 superfamily member 11-like isoform X2 n=1 Tax=Triticum dicoccoides TaxID=85692 RepID=UPI00188E891E|nr:transmembrane 9 superfamily member 11-like isoform X2 [Triticum dicoccoides]
MATAAMASPTTSTLLLFMMLFLHLNISPATAFYLPGSYPHRYLPGEALGVNRAAESLGELLLGDRIETSPYRFSMLTNSTAALFLCRTDPLPPAAADLIRSRIDDAYHVNLLLDTLPVVRYVNNPIAPDVLLRSTGFPVGVRADDGEYYVYNHLRLTVLVNKQKNGTARVEALMATADASELIGLSGGGGGGGGGYTVVGFEVVPCSVEHDEAAINGKKMYDGFSSKAAAGCDPSVVGMRVQANRPLAFSYEVAFVESAVEWPSRWDAYLEMGGAQVHWFSILNSIVVVAFLAAIVLVILLRTVRRDLAQYEELGSEAAPHADDMAGWKLVAGDAFREPSHPVLLCVMVGDGVRILGMGVVTILFAALGFMSPASRGALVNGMLCLYLVLGLAAGYTAVRLWKTVRHGDSAGWKAVAWRASFVFPGIGFSVFTALNCVLWYNGSTGAVPFALFVVLILLWFFVSVPLTLAGGLLASRVRGHVEYPVKTNKIARQVPAAQCSPWVFVAVAGTLPFGTLFIELFFIMSSLWLGRVYYVFGFLLVVLGLLVAVCAEVSLVLTYMGLCVEDWRWWWRSFFASGSVAAYILGYAVYYLVFDLHSLSGPVSAALYVGYSLLMALAVMLATGAVGLAASFCFVYYLFSTVKLD